MQLVGAYAWSLPLAVASAAGGLLLLVICCRPATACRLDISPVGQVRLAVYLDSTARDSAAPAAVPASIALPSQSSLCRLLPGTTLWPALLVLRLMDGQGRRCSVLVQRGAYGCPAFRALAVACRVLAARQEPDGEKK
ncbi:hypothetical protein [Janthinobacterium aquaticum]|uniref:hypothetical protein n=1 Tax=Janthinobacterium sp. FT58W TaxID=2654254 RepID=UPI00126507C1|nr:hypothetical protein [Janthinobacterium sp. FT58W]KAB8045299.1 hypothetical protein GCM43_02510 [Janthinobacterium sp. FT58W]